MLLSLINNKDGIGIGYFSISMLEQASKSLDFTKMWSNSSKKEVVKISKIRKWWKHPASRIKEDKIGMKALMIEATTLNTIRGVSQDRSSKTISQRRNTTKWLRTYLPRMMRHCYLFLNEIDQTLPNSSNIEYNL